MARQVFVESFCCYTHIIDIVPPTILSTENGIGFDIGQTALDDFLTWNKVMIQVYNPDGVVDNRITIINRKF